MESECNGEGKGKSLNGSQFERSKAKGSQRSWVELLELETLLSWSLTGTIDMFAELVKMEMRIEEGKAKYEQKWNFAEAKDYFNYRATFAKKFSF